LRTSLDEKNEETLWNIYNAIREIEYTFRVLKTDLVTVPNHETGKSFYTHKRLRSAYRSLKNNIQWLFTWYDYIGLKIPNTTNAIDGHFADLKNKLRNHNGLSLNRKMKFIDGFLKA
jgi:hypothetical protein